MKSAISRLSAPYRIVGLAAIVAIATSSVAIATDVPSSSSSQQPTRQQLAQRLLADTTATRYMSSMGLTALEKLAGATSTGEADQVAARSPQVRDISSMSPAAPAPQGSLLTNVRVNDPTEDNTQFGSNPDGSTQSETTMAVQGKNIVVGFNDSQQTDNSERVTAGFDWTGYAYSTDGGVSFKDGGTVPNGASPAPLGFSLDQNVGDPWITVDQGAAGPVKPEYFGTLAMNPAAGSTDVGVAKSTDAGKTWSPTVMVDKLDAPFVLNDKDGVAAGRNPAGTGRNVYAAYDGFNESYTALLSTDWDVSISTNGGSTWIEHQIFNLPYVSTPTMCQYQQVIGSNPFVDPSNGTLYVAAFMIQWSSTTKACFTTPPTYSEVIVSSTDGGVTFSPIHTVATLLAPLGGLKTGPGKLMRLDPFPYMAKLGTALWVSWQEGVSVFVAKSTDGGVTWSAPIQASPSIAAISIQPSLMADSTGLHIAYFQSKFVPGCGSCLTVYEASSKTGSLGTWASRQISNRAFPFDLTYPNFDPGVAWGYMGDYIAIASAGAAQCLSWGDNRDIVKDYMYPGGRNDPNVYAACG